jgi:PAS domain S-box-containing protein
VETPANSQDGAAPRLVSLKWQTLALVSIALVVVHGLLVFQAYSAELARLLSRQALTFEHQVTVLRNLIDQSNARLQRIGAVVPGAVNAMTMGERFEERWQAVQLELGLDVMQVYDGKGLAAMVGLAPWAQPPLELQRSIQRTLREERPSTFLQCRPECVQYSLAPLIGIDGSRQAMVLATSLADVVLAFPAMTGADVALLAEPAPDQGAAYWGSYHLAALSAAPRNEPKLRALSAAVTLQQVEEGQNLSFGGRDYRFFARPLASFGGIGSGYIIIFNDLTDALADIRAQLRNQLVAGFAALLAALLLLLLILNRPMNQLRKLAAALPLLAAQGYEAARLMIGNPHRQRRHRSEIEVVEEAAVNLSHQLETLERTVDARNRALAEKISELRQASELNEKMFANAPVIILIQGPDNSLLRINEFGTTLLGYSASEMKGRSFPSLMADARQREEAMNVLADVAAGRRQQFEQTGPVLCVDGSLERITWLHTRLSAQSGIYILSLGLPDRSQTGTSHGTP